MKHTKVYPTIWQSIPFSLDMMDQWDDKGNRIQDLILSNETAFEKGVSEMILNVSKLSVFDDKGEEHFIDKFKGNEALNLKGVHTGLFIKTREVLELEPGRYKSFRFYLKGRDNSFIYKDRSVQEISGFSFFDFEIQNGLVLNGEESKQVILRFDFEPYSLSSFFKSIISRLKKRESKKQRWANSLG